ncbi:MAG TPA: HAMP domain-containing sensor histidine kinase [Acidimicrobiia bacterium]|nr:HAMP domain-containing sensor histidine kinase [Acidimicrobiia bacterium]
MTLVRFIELLALTLGTIALVIIPLAFFFLSQARRREQEAVDAAGKSAEFTKDMMGMVAHDMRGPLQTIVGLTETVRDRWRHLPADEVDRALDTVASQGRRLSGLIEDLMVIPGAETGRLRVELIEMDLVPLVCRVSETVFGDEESKVEVDLPDTAVVVADPNRVEQVVRNLVENARKYGRPPVVVEGAARSGQFVLTVADGGPGIPPGEEERLFEPFERTQDQASGIGLGLPIARTLARAMGGDVTYEPGVPTGARFSFSLPLSSA